MSLAACWTSRRPCVFFRLGFLFFLSVFLTYYFSDIKFPTYFFHMGRLRHSHKIQAAPVDTEPDTVLLIWTWPFGYKDDFRCSLFNITKCHLTDDRSVYHKADGVLFHHPEIEENRGIIPREPRPWFQKWVWFTMEAPLHTKPIPELNNLFNLTCNFRQDSNIPVPYGYLLPVTPGGETFKLPAKDKLVCWIVSAWEPQYERVKYYEELKKHIKVDTYGKAFGSSVTHSKYLKIVPSCKFYLSFENSIYKDYITEKLYRPMTLGTVPIVLGPSRQNYEDHIPGDSFIHVNDFPSPKELADRIQYLNKNSNEYMKYFEWRKRYKATSSYFGPEQACRTCKYLRSHKGNETFYGLNKWYWG